MDCSKTRIAPTPSGFLHLGNAYSFVHTAVLAATTGAKILLRIDDMDWQRTRHEYVEDIFATLEYLQIRWDEGPRDAKDLEEHWSQRNRMELYSEALLRLESDGHIFACECSRSELLHSGGICPCAAKNIGLHSNGVAWRLRTDSTQTMYCKDFHGKEREAMLPKEMLHFVVRKKDGLPAYQLSSLVDDVHFGVDLVVRGQDLWPSTLAQLYLARLLGMEGFLTATFVHHPLLTDDFGEKLSKSAGSTSVRSWRLAGKLPEEIRKYCI
ncbi:MAG: glutamate--tRNA ligase family protein [Chitinophagaceae bacterium]